MFSDKFNKQWQVFESLLNQLQRQLESNQDSTQIGLLYDCVTFSVGLARQILQRELSIDPVGFVQLLEPYLIENDGSNKPLHVHLHLSDLQSLQLHSAWPQLQQHCQFSTHPELSVGDLMIETETQFIDARINVRMQKLLDELYQSVSIDSENQTDSQVLD